MSREIREDDLQAFVDDQLDPRRRAEVIAHLADHPEERRRVDAHLRHKQELRERLTALAGDRHDALTERLAAELGARLERRPRRAWWRQAAAAVLLFGLGWVGHVGYQEYKLWRLPPIVTGAAQAHQMFAEDPRRPVELPASASAELAQWFSDHLGEAVHIPDLRQIGLHFVGGRLLGTEHGPLAQMLYEDHRGRRLTLYLSPEETDAGPEVQVVQIDGFTAGYWKGDTLVYTIVAETPTEQLLAIASELGGQEPRRP